MSRHDKTARKTAFSVSAKSVFSSLRRPAFFFLMLLFALSGMISQLRGDPFRFSFRKAEQIIALLEFVEWPVANEDIFVIGLVGDDPVAQALESFDGEELFDGRGFLRVERVGEYSRESDINSCRVLYIASSVKDDLWHIRRSVQGEPVLTVASIPGSLGKGVMVNLLIQNEQVRWEIDKHMMDQCDIRPDAQILRAAVRVITFETEIFGR